MQLSLPKYLYVCVMTLFPLFAAHATVMKPYGLDGLVQKAETVVVGTVERQASRWTEDRKFIVTDMTLRVSQTIWGNSEKTVVVRRFGGSVDGIGMRIAGNVVLKDGDQVVLFCKQRGKHRFVVGMRQGAYHVARGSDGALRVSRDLNGITFAEQQAGTKTLALRSASDTSSERLDTFIEKIRKLRRSVRSQESK